MKEGGDKMSFNSSDNTYITTDLVNSNFDDDVSDNEDDTGVLREQDRYLPIAIIARIMKRAIPSNAKIAKDARECCQECVSEFISFITSEAADRCQAEKRKTINGEDILYAMSQLGFDNYVEPLKLYLQKYRQVMKGEAGGSVEGYEVLSNDIMVSDGEHQSGNQVIIAYDGNNQLHGFQLG